MGDDVAVPCEPQPLHVLIDAVDELRPAPPLVQILDPHAPVIARCAADDRAIGMAEMQAPGRRGGEAAGGHCCKRDS